MNREKFPEKVPFRLTRMMTKAMEVSGIEGNFRSDMHLVICRCHVRFVFLRNVVVCLVKQRSNKNFDKTS